MSSFLVDGGGKPLIAETLAQRGRTPTCATSLPKYFTVALANSHFDRLTVRRPLTRRSNNARKH